MVQAVSNKMMRLTPEQINTKLQFINNYAHAVNAATGSTFDPNSNVTSKNVATLMAELNKDIQIQLKRALISKKLVKLFNQSVADNYNDQLENHLIYANDESGTVLPYCAAVSIYPFLENGLQTLGGDSKAPKHLSSFNGGFINLVFALSSQFAGAIATVEYLTCFDYFARKDYGDNYLENHKNIIQQELQQVVYALNQPAASRGYQCVTETTQLWTPTGFKYLSELKSGDECYAWKHNKIVKSKILQLNVYDYNGELIQFTGRNIQQTVTPNHRVLYKIPNTNNKYDLKEAKTLIGHSSLAIPIGANNDFLDYPISDELLTLCTLALTDGSFDIKNDHSTRLRFYMSPNRKGLKVCLDALNKLNMTYTQTDSKVNKFGLLKIICVSVKDSTIIANYLPNKKLAIPDFFKHLSQRQAQLVLNLWSITDGQQDEHGTMLLQCDSLDIAKELQEIVLLAGHGSAIITHQRTKINNNDETGEILYVKVFKRINKRVSKYNTVYYKGKIWCPTTSEGVVIFRENNNIPYISGNSCFWNISIFDKYFFQSLFEHFTFPDGSKANWETVNKLQKFFMTWFNQERTKSLLTFPVVTVTFLTKNKCIMDNEYYNFVSKELSQGNSFFIYMSDTVDSLSSCCRLRSNIQDQLNDFQYSLGAGGVMTGSIQVLTLNVNRFIQQYTKSTLYADILSDLKTQLKLMYKYHVAFREILKDLLQANMLPAYTANFINLNKQYSTIGLNGVLEGAEYRGFSPETDMKAYINFLKDLFQTISDTNESASVFYACKFNTELIPAESVGVKFANWDKKDDLFAPRDCYNSYLYPVESEKLTVIDKFKLHGYRTMQYMDGGSALHINLEEYPTQDGFKKLLNIAAETGCPYFCFNVKVTICNKCGYIDKRTLTHCSKCGSTNIDYASRVIGYLKRISNYSAERQEEAMKRYYHLT